MKIISKMRSMFAHLFAMIFDLIKKLFFLLEFFLFLRLTLKFMEANPKSFIVELIYKWSDFFVSPFNSIFKDIFWPKGYVIDAATVSAMIGYTILVFVIFRMIQPFSRN